MSSLNKIVLIGKLTADPEIRVTTEGTSLTKYALEVDRPFAQNNKTDIINIVSWGKLAEQDANDFKKNMLVLVEGRIQVRTMDDKAGDRTWITEVVANYTAPMTGKNAGAHKAETKEEVKEETTEDDIPF
ncbi:MAG: single-stranded DNA-binding protein [Candidatus Margulisbacteria bacterium]|nr:single-stranded DNA-binding protein [Candidatus Margulisiibacteriota bacterium]